MSDKSLKIGPRERIIETAQSLFFAQGYKATGINQIIKEAKVAKASFYDHFPSKDDLGEAYLNLSSEMVFNRFADVINSKSNPKEGLLGLFDFFIEEGVPKIYPLNKFIGFANSRPFHLFIFIFHLSSPSRVIRNLTEASLMKILIGLLFSR